jgi:hypothetical protein
MASERRSTGSSRIAQGDISSGDSGEDEDYDPEKDCSGSVTAQKPKSRASRKATSKQKGKQPEKRRNAGSLSELPDMPLDTLYEVNRRTISVTNDEIYGDALGVHRYSLLSTRWVCYGCRGPTRPFVTFS